MAFKNLVSRSPIKKEAQDALRESAGLPQGRGRVTRVKIDLETDRVQGHVIVPRGFSAEGGVLVAAISPDAAEQHQKFLSEEALQDRCFAEGKKVGFEFPNEEPKNPYGRDWKNEERSRLERVSHHYWRNGWEAGRERYFSRFCQICRRRDESIVHGFHVFDIDLVYGDHDLATQRYRYFKACASCRAFVQETEAERMNVDRPSDDPPPGASVGPKDHRKERFAVMFENSDGPESLHGCRYYGGGSLYGTTDAQKALLMRKSVAQRQAKKLDGRIVSEFEMDRIIADEKKAAEAQFEAENEAERIMSERSGGGNPVAVISSPPEPTSPPPAVEPVEPGTEEGCRACERYPVLCGCGWGNLSLPACEVPQFCPVCGFDFWANLEEPDISENCARLI